MAAGNRPHFTKAGQWTAHQKTRFSRMDADKAKYFIFRIILPKLVTYHFVYDIGTGTKSTLLIRRHNASNRVYQLFDAQKNKRSSKLIYSGCKTMATYKGSLFPWWMENISCIKGLTWSNPADSSAKSDVKVCRSFYNWSYTLSTRNHRVLWSSLEDWVWFQRARTRNWQCTDTVQRCPSCD